MRLGAERPPRCPQPALEPGPLDPESCALTMRPSRLPHACIMTFKSKGIPKITVLYQKKTEIIIIL